MSSDLTVGILGCGSLGTAILQGLLHDGATLVTSGGQSRQTKFQATVTSQRSADSLKRTFGSSSADVQVSVGQNVDVAASSDVVLLVCPPNVMSDVLGESGMAAALRGKTLISVLAGVTRTDMEKALYGDELTKQNPQEMCWVVRSMTNLAVSVGKGANVVDVSHPHLPSDQIELVDAVFNKLGKTVHVTENLMNAATVLCGSTPAFIALFADALIDGAVAAGVPRSQAQAVTAQVLSSTAALLQDGTSPSALRENICAQPGCTIKGVLTLEQGNIRGAASRAMAEAIEAASGLVKKT